MWVNYGSLLWSAVLMTPLTTKKVEFIVEYLREYEAICKKALTRVSEAQMELFDEKTRGRKSRERVPLILVNHLFHQTGLVALVVRVESLYSMTE
jgi:hypothetical protein